MNTDKITIAQEFTLNIQGAIIKLTKDEARSLRDELDRLLDDKPKIPTGPIYRGPIQNPEPIPASRRKICEVCHKEDASVILTAVVRGEMQKMDACPDCVQRWGGEIKPPFGPITRVPTDADVTNAYNSR